MKLIVTILFWNMIMIPPLIPNGFTLKFLTFERISSINLQWLTWLRMIVVTIRAKNHFSTQLKKHQGREVLAGIEMETISLISKIQWRKKAVETIIHSNLKFPLNTMMMKYMWLIVTHIHTLIVVCFLINFVQIKQKIKFERLCWQKLLLVIIAKW